MGFNRDRDRDRDDRGGGFGRRTRGKQCRSCKYLDYKDAAGMRKFISAHGKIYSRKRAQTCAKCQRLVKQAVKRARFMGILSHTN